MSTDIHSRETPLCVCVFVFKCIKYKKYMIIAKLMADNHKLACLCLCEAKC